MIRSFADRDTGQLFHGEKNRRFMSIARVALRKLFQMNRAGVLQDLAVPPGRRLEALPGNRSGFPSLRINDPWRLVFRWAEKVPAPLAMAD